MREAAANYRYSRSVFIAPPWREIFAQDTERKQTFEEAVRTYESMVNVYTALGYERIELPFVPVAARAAFVIEAARHSMASSRAP
jgi:predicted ATPase